MREILETSLSGLSQALVPLFSYSDNLDVADQILLTKSFGAIKVWFINWIATNNRDIGALDPALWDRKNRCPLVLSDFFLWFHPTYDKHTASAAIRFVLSWLDLPKVYTIPQNPSLEPITGLFSGRDPILRDYDLLEAINSLGLDVKELQSVFNTECKNFQFHESSAAGPNGHALWASHLDAVALQEDLDLYDV